MVIFFGSVGAVQVVHEFGWGGRGAAFMGGLLAGLAEVLAQRGGRQVGGRG